MTASSAVDAKATADALLSSGDYAGALRAYAAGLAADPESLDLRLRVADALLACGEVVRARTVYAALATHAAHVGHPLYALIAVKLLAELEEPELPALVRTIADAYALDSGRIGRAVRPIAGTRPVLLGAASERVLSCVPDELNGLAETLGCDLSGAGAAPPGPLPPLPLFSELTRVDFATVVGAVQLVRKPRGGRVIEQGQPGTSFFVVARGDLRVVQHTEAGQQISLSTLHAGSLVGEMALVSRAARSADVIAETDADLLELPIDVLSRLSRGAQNVARALDKFTRERLVMNLISSAALFRPLDRTQRIDLVRRFVAHEVAKGTDLVREGEAGPGLFLILTGAVDVHKRDGEEKVLLATLRNGEVFGEMSLLSGGVVTATVTAAQRSTVLLLGREYVEKLFDTVPALRSYLEALSDERELDTRLWLSRVAPALPLEAELDIEILEG